MYDELLRGLYQELSELTANLNEQKDKNYDGLFVLIISPEALHATFGGQKDKYPEYVERIYRLASLEIPPKYDDTNSLPITIDPESISYVEKNNRFSMNFLRQHGSRSNPWHDGALIYLVDKDNKLRLIAASVLVYPKPELFESRNNGGIHGGRYNAARNISRYPYVLGVYIIETNGNTKYTLHSFKNSQEINY